MKTIQLADQAQPKGHYSLSIEHNGLIFMSGQLSIEYAVEATKWLGLKLEGSVG